MALFAGRKSKKRFDNALFTAVDLGTEYIKCLVFEKAEDSCLCLGKSTIQHTSGAMRGGAIANIPQVATDLRRAIDTATPEGVDQPKQIIVSLAGDLVKSLVTTIHYHRSSINDHIDNNELKNLIHKSQWKALEQIRQLGNQDNQADLGEMKIINTTIVDARIDGYKVSNPLNFQGKIVSLSLFNAFAPISHLKSLEDLAEVLDLEITNVAAAPYALTKSLLVDNPEFSGIFIDVGAHSTDVAVVHEGGIFGMQSFALGGEAFTRKLAVDLNITPLKAEKIKKDYAKGLLDKRSNEKIKKSMQAIAITWSRSVAESLDEFSHLDELPQEIFIGGGGAPLPEVAKSLQTKAWSASLPFTSKPKAILLKEQDVGCISLPEKLSLESSDLVVSGLANLILNLPDRAAELNSILSRIMTNMKTTV
ncbi:MAG: cell division FtsA domain-containing protein [Patescibacteria group bacterium]|nr:cell division FtsA domain-containing protein [Patescibacteria group bacterium]